ncbi:DegV family protein [Facklamia sp. DSM 111018]|uniref:DegV family protein n=1 Tax=Facklamia lactis TaxID=2749967 RepID=A0ABS0LSN1_9LACT|nr:DegV family protein [Facklamia lactis]MBG9981441.1 DegV family protein [Facklamia lactis]MBG9987083.1 DegV family protein [Facklamia lactis]
MKTAIIVDSTAYLTEDIRRHPDVYEINLSVLFEDGTYFEDTADGDEQRKFFNLLKRSPHLPTSSQPQPGLYYQLIEDLIAKGYQAFIAIHLSSAISGTFNLAQSLIREFADQIQGWAIDSKASCIVLEVLVRHGIKLLENKVDPTKVVQFLRWQAEHTEIYLMVGELDNLVKGGRLSAGAAAIGQLLKIKPILTFNQIGEIVLLEKIRTNKKVYQRWLQLIAKALDTYPQGVSILVTHANNEVDLEKLVEKITTVYPDLPLYINTIGPVVGTHIGEGSLGMAVMPHVKEE